ncbi:MAG: ATP-binding protein [Pseudomonadota bacterium]
MSSRKVPTPRESAGIGFDYEDHIAAWLLLQILNGGRIFGLNGSPLQVRWQTRASGWEFDDLLITLRDSDKTFHLAISCKLPKQFTSSGLTADARDSVLKQWQETQGPFDAKSDYFAIITDRYNESFASSWRDLKHWLSGDDSALALDRIKSSDKHKKVFASLQDPNQGVSSDQAAEIVNRLFIQRLDLQDQSSVDFSYTIGGCRNILKSGTNAEALELWNELLKTSRSARLTHGTVTRSTLLADLSSNFSLTDAPDYRADLDTLWAMSEETRNHISLELPNGPSFKRPQETELARLSEEQSVIALIGESGCGKSALIRRLTEHEDTPKRALWLGPETLQLFSSHALSRQTGLQHPLPDLILALGTETKIIVLDSIERMDEKSVRLARQIADETERHPSRFNLLLSSQPERFESNLRRILPNERPHVFEVENLEASEVSEILAAYPKLHWVGLNSEVLSALSNFRTLSWLIDAGQDLGGDGQLKSHIDLADAIWNFWTTGSAPIQRSLVLLAEREAEFERSFAQSELADSDLTRLEEAKASLPVRKDASNRYRFSHDLAADWARYQRLKELSQNWQSWAVFSDKPLWITALRLLGQFLLRQPGQQGTAWDDTYLAIEQSQTPNQLALDVLLDALFLDPDATSYLSKRKTFLFEEKGKRLLRLLRRFHHVATTPDPILLTLMPDAFQVFAETGGRIPIWGRWPSLLSFLYANLEDVAALQSISVSMLCETWLRASPKKTTQGDVFPYRIQAGEIAIATARSVQADALAGTIFIGDGDKRLYQTAFMAAGEHEDEVSNWALEVAGRRPISGKVLVESAKLRKERDAKRRENRKANAKRRGFVRETVPSPRLFDTSIKLKPWPIAPTRQVDHRFVDACLDPYALVPLMKHRPKVALEILLAIVSDEAPEKRERSGLGEEFGLTYNNGPSGAYFESPFYPLFQIDPDLALEGLIELTNLCADRWVENYDWNTKKWQGTINLDIEQSGSSPFFGAQQTLLLSYKAYGGAAVLSCALAAMEKWLLDKIEADDPIDGILARILGQSRFVGMLGPLTSIAKFKPALLDGPLKALLTDPLLILWDEANMPSVKMGFDGYEWARKGEYKFELAKTWFLAGQRQTKLRDIGSERVLRSPALASYLEPIVVSWGSQQHDNIYEAIQALAKEFTPANYAINEDGGFEYVPPPVQTEEERQVVKNSQIKLQDLNLARRVSQILGQGAVLTKSSAEHAWKMYKQIDEREDIEPDLRLRNRIALSLVLATAGKDWLDTHPRNRTKILKSIRQSVVNLVEDANINAFDLHKYGDMSSLLAAVVTLLWINQENTEEAWDEEVVKLATSGEPSCQGGVFTIARRHRDAIGNKWQRLLQLAFYSSALDGLSPMRSLDDESEVQRWERWRARLQAARLDVNVKLKQFDPFDLSIRMNRLLNIRHRRHARNENWKFRGYSEEIFRGLNTCALQGPVAHLQDTLLERLEDQALAEGYLRYGLHRQSKDKHDSEEFDHPDLIETAILNSAAMSCFGQDDPELWKSVFDVGPAAHEAVEKFGYSLFRQVSVVPTDRFLSVWSKIIAHKNSLDVWKKDNYRSNRDVATAMASLLGMSNGSVLAALPDQRTFYRVIQPELNAWAEHFLRYDSTFIANYCIYLNQWKAPVLIRDSVLLLAELIKTQDGLGYWSRYDDVASMIAELVADQIETAEGNTLSGRDHLQALSAIAGELVRRQYPIGLALQERIASVR